MAVKPGYKQTEVGIIPEDWDVVRLPGLVSSGPRNGYSGRSGKDARGTPTLALTATTTGRMILDEDTVKYLEESLEDHSDILLKAGDVLVQRANTLELVGTTAIFDGPSGVYAYPDLMMRLRFRAPETAHWFWRYANSARGRRYFVSVAAGSTGTMPKLSGDKLRTMPLPLPSPTEQRAIAGALSDADGLLGGLDRLIAKKRDLKQATMQQLLTGQTRLPGFRGEWKALNMAEDSTLKARIGWQGLTTAEYLKTGEFYLVTGTDFSDGRIDWSNCCYVAEQRYTQDKNIQLRPNDILLTKDGTIGKVAFIDELPGLATLNSGVFVIRPKDGAYDPRYFYFVLTSRVFDEFLTRLQAGSTITHLYQKDFVSFSFLAPPTLAEQTAIAEMLREMDGELASLEQRRKKTRALKQAMMQELLTGRIRFVANSSQATVLPFVDSASPAQPNPQKAAHSWAFNEAVVIAVLAGEFGGPQFPLGRMRYTKLAYLLHRHAEHVAEGYLKKAAGPYNPATRYAGPEKIACESGYIKRHKRDQFEGFIAGEKNAQARAYFLEWYGQAALDWLQQFRFWKKEELERVATVDMAMEELRRANRKATVDTVKEIIASSPEWLSKLDRAVFADAHLDAAIKQCRTLFPIC